MRRRHGPDEVKRYDFGKWMVLLVLIAIFVLLFLFRSLQDYDEPQQVSLNVTPISTYTTEARVISPVLLSPAPGSEVDAGRIALTGTSAPGALVQIILNGLSIGEVEADSKGAWSTVLELTEPGSQEVVVQTVGPNNDVAATEPIALRVVVPSLEITPPSLDLTVLDSKLVPGMVALNGTGEPGTDLTVLVNGEVIGTVVVATDGFWSLEAEFDAPGLYAVSLASSSVSGEPLAAATAIAIEVAASEETVAQVSATPTGTQAAQTTIVDTAPAEPAEVLATQVVDAGADLAAETLEPPTIDMTLLVGDASSETAFVRIAGTAQPRQQLDVLIGDVLVARVAADDQGDWFYVTRVNRPGEYQFSARSTGGLQSEPVRFVAAPLPSDNVEVGAEPARSAVLAIDPLPGLSQPPGLVVLAGTGVPGNGVEISVDDIVLGSAIVAPNGTWNFIARLLEEGTYLVRASSNGAQAEPINAVITADAIANLPADVGSAITPSVDSSLADQSHPPGFVTLFGTGEGGSEVEIKVGDVVVGRVMVNEDGAWTLLSRLETPGVYVVIATDSAGRQSNPAAVVIAETKIAAAAPTSTPTEEPTATDTAEPTATETPVPTDTSTPEPTETPTEEPTAGSRRHRDTGSDRHFDT